MASDDGGVILPRHYGEGFEFDDGLEDLIANRLNRMEKGRRFWGRLADTWIYTLVRNLIPILAIFINFQCKRCFEDARRGTCFSVTSRWAAEFSRTPDQMQKQLHAQI